MAVVTVQGTWTPAVGGPARGERWEVEVDARVRGWARSGAVTVVSGSLQSSAADPAPAAWDGSDATGVDDDDPDHECSGDEPVAPARNASRAEWADYLRAKGIRFPDDRQAFEDGDRRAWASRDDLIIIEQQAIGGR